MYEHNRQSCCRVIAIDSFLMTDCTKESHLSSPPIADAPSPAVSVVIYHNSADYDHLDRSKRPSLVSDLQRF